MTKNTRMIIFGGAGFIGRHLSKHLAAQGFEVVVFDRYFHLTDEAFNFAQCVIGDFSDRSKLNKILREGDTCFHLVCSTVPGTSNQDPLFDLKSNVAPTLDFLDLAVSRKVARVIFSSSGGTVYGPAPSLPIDENHPTNPVSSYGISKLTIEKYLSLYHRLYGLKVCSLRLANPYGPWIKPGQQQGAVPVFMGRAQAGKPIEIWGDGSIIRDYIYIHDIVAAFAKAAELETGEAVFNIGSGTGHSLKQIVAAIAEIAGRELQVNYYPGRACDVPANILNIKRAEKELGWQPRTSLKEGLSATWQGLTQAI